MSMLLSSAYFFVIICPPPRSTLFPYTTLFRSEGRGAAARRGRSAQREVPTQQTDSDLVGLAHGDRVQVPQDRNQFAASDRKSTRLNSSHLVISYAVFCLKKKNIHKMYIHI